MLADTADAGVELGSLDVFEPDWTALNGATDENPFMHASVELLKSAITNSMLLASIKTAEPHDRDSAIRCGLLLRGCKIGHAMVRDACRDQGFLQLSLSRQLIETLANLRYLCTDQSGERHTAFVMDSLISEREFLRNVERQVQAVGGRERSIEQRIRRSIERTAAASGIELATLPRRRDIGWPSVEVRIELAFGTTAYPAYRVGSDALHGGWNDLLRNHLRQVDGGFEPEYGYQRVRPQSLSTAAVQVADAGLDYVSRRSEAEHTVFIEPLAALVGFALRVGDLHEQWLDALSDGQ